MKSESDNIKFVHFGRINTRIKKIIEIANIFPNIDIDLYGYTNFFLMHKIVITNKNIHFKNSNFIEDVKLYKIVKDNNTFVLSFSEFPEQCYYSNRIPMLLGYSSLVIQEKFKNVDKYFSNKEMIIYGNMDELKTKVNSLINDFNKQNIIRANALEISKKYSFDNYILNILNTIN